MKLSMTSAALALLVLAGCASNPAPGADTAHTHPDAVRDVSSPVERPTETLPTGLQEARVNGLSCPLCAESLSSVMSRLDGVEGIRLDLEQGLVRMTIGKPAPTRGAVAKAIDDAGFTFVSFVDDAGE